MLRQLAVLLGLSVWFAAALYVVATLSVTHLAAYGQPQRLADLKRFAEAQRTTPADGGLLVLHVIEESCSCTTGLFNALVRRGRWPDIDEHILFIGASPVRAERARAAAFRFQPLDGRDAVERLGLPAAPVMIVLDGDGTLVYAGGYFDHPAAAVSLDERLLRALQEGQRPAPLPIFGCALDEEVRRAVDPLGLT